MSEKPNFQNAVRRADKLIRAYNIVSAPVPIVEITEGEGLSIAVTSLEEFRIQKSTVCAALLKSQKIILLEKADSAPRRRFSIAHELGHYILHADELENNPELGIFFRAPLEKESNPLEQEANCFAANLLVPTNMLKEWFSKTQNQHQLAEIFAVSSELIGWRLINAGLRNE